MKPQEDDPKQISRLEEQLKLAQERFHIIFQNTTVSIWDYIYETRKIVQPSRSQEMHGFHDIVENVPDSLIDSGDVHPDSADAFRELYDKLFAGEEQVEGVFRVQTTALDTGMSTSVIMHCLTRTGNPMQRWECPPMIPMKLYCSRKQIVIP